MSAGVKERNVKTCDICHFSSDDLDDVLSYGEWMQKQATKVHYFCLLLSTNLLQRGGDSSGILGFLMRDIRNEINIANQRKCIFCNKFHASIACAGCKNYFHLACGRDNFCISEFTGEFRTYCIKCAPIDEYKAKLLTQPPVNIVCDICFISIKCFSPASVTYGDCCKKGFAHRVCMQRYALASGYYLRCIWCRSKSFRELIRLQSVFVPDRDATWERENNAFRELHRSHTRCDWDVCLCNHGRDFNKVNWSIVLCTLCASFGAHRQCIVGKKRMFNVLNNFNEKFKCPTCVEVEQKLDTSVSNCADLLPKNDKIDTSFYVIKKPSTIVMSKPTTEFEAYTPTFSDDDSLSSSIITVVPSANIGNCVTQKTASTPTKSSALTTAEATQQLAEESSIASTIKLPLQLQNSYSQPPYFFLNVYMFDEHDPYKCIGTVTLRFNENDPRIKNKTQEALEQLHIIPNDIYSSNKEERGIYKVIDMLADMFNE